MDSRNDVSSDDEIINNDNNTIDQESTGIKRRKRKQSKYRKIAVVGDYNSKLRYQTFLFKIAQSSEEGLMMMMKMLNFQKYSKTVQEHCYAKKKKESISNTNSAENNQNFLDYNSLKNSNS